MSNIPFKIFPHNLFALWLLLSLFVTYKFIMAKGITRHIIDFEGLYGWMSKKTTD